MINLKCLNCAANLEISSDMTIFACGHCGGQQMVERKGGTVALKTVTDAISRVQVGTDKTAAELALRRLEKEVRELDEQRRRREVLGRHEIDQTNKQGIWLGIVGFIVGVIAGNNMGGDIFLPMMALVGIVAGLGTGIYIKSKKDKVIKERTTDELNAIDSQITTVRRKIATHIRIAES